MAGLRDTCLTKTTGRLKPSVTATSTTQVSAARYVGGPFDGGTNPDGVIDAIEMRTPAG
ncbi:hypothetical protein ACLB9X_10930 [Streptomyces sp. 5K101]|uniref:hypothetical protein n=1 Tax=Streptomyces sp. 5K101 TaxID=3390037 RepID=UPI003976C13A